MEFQNRQVAVTGASGGIGRAISAHLTAQGLSVFGLDRVAPQEQLPGVQPVEVDVTVPSSVEAAVALIYETAPGPVDLVCCAGIVEDDVAAEDMPIDLFDAILGVNLRGLFLSCQAFGRQLLARGGGASSTLRPCRATTSSIFPSVSAPTTLRRRASRLSPSRSPSNGGLVVYG